MADDVDLAQQSLPARPPVLTTGSTSPVADVGPTIQQQAGNQAMQRNASLTALSSAPAPAVILDLDPIRPWFVPVPLHAQPDDVKTLLYGEKGGELQPAIFPESDLFQVSQGYIIQPLNLVPGRSAEYETLISVRQALLDVELASDIAAIKDILDMPDMIRHAYEEKVISKLWRWAHEPFRTKPPRNFREMYTSQYLDNLLLKLGMATKDVGWIATSWTSYYDMLFNRLDRSDEIEQIRDGYSRDFVGEKPIHETKFFGTGKDDFFGMFWEDVGEVAYRIGNYFLGMLDAGAGLLKGLYTLITDPRKAIESLVNLPHNLSVMWKNRDKIWNEFVNASPKQQSRMIGRIFGEAEILIATFEAGGGPKAPVPGLAVAEEVVPVGGNAAALTMGGGAAIPINLGKLGAEATRVTALMSTATEGGQKGEQQAQNLSSEEAPSKPAAEEKPPSKEPPESKPSRPARAPQRAAGPRFERGRVGYRLEGTPEDFARVAESPPGSQVYIIRNAAGEPIYVGITERTSITRLLEHLANQPGEWIGSASKVEITGEGLLERQARALEQDLIEDLKPEFNKELDPYSRKYGTAPNPADVRSAHNTRIILDIIQGI
jgi:hypothetical protein